VRDKTREGVTPWRADPTYGSGELPWLTRLRWELSNKPVLLWLVLFGAVLALSLITFVLLQRHAIRRRAGSPL
jgi:type II secretory pathway component PulF